MRIALTGATGFVGRATVAEAVRRGHECIALARRAQPAQLGVNWISGDLAAHAALDALVTGADAVVHIAGVVNAPDRAAFAAGNADGTANLIAAMERQGTKRLVHVSSLAAREPELSDYGWSKAEAEHHVETSSLDWTMVRPPAIYGGDDKDMLELFVMAKRGLMLLPPAGRISVIAVQNLASLLVSLAERTDAGLGATYEVADGNPQGWSHADFGQALAQAVGRSNVLTLALPALLVRLAARGDRLVRGHKARLTPDRASYMCHPDWVSRAELMPPREIWQPTLSTVDGLAATAATYRAKGWL